MINIKKWIQRYLLRTASTGKAMKRPVTEAEANVIRMVAERLPPDQKHQLLDDLLHAEAEPTNHDGSIIRFDILGYQHPSHRGQGSYGVEGELYDKDGAQLSFDLFADANGRLLELEIIRWGDGDLIEPDWSTLKLY